MASIDTEEAARRLARVILSDIELYHRERPKQGETLEAQIEQGRKHFASRVTPDLLPVFGLVLSDRALGRVNSPAAGEPPSTGASTAATLDSNDASPASEPTIQDQSTPAPSIAAQPLEDQPTPAPSIAAQPLEDQPTPAPSIAAPPLEDQPTPAPSIAAPPLEDQSTPAPALAAPPPVDQPALTARVPTTPLTPATPAAPAQARPVAPPAPEIAVPVLTARLSIPRLLAIMSVVAATVAVLYLLVP